MVYYKKKCTFTILRVSLESDIVILYEFTHTNRSFEGINLNIQQ